MAGSAEDDAFARLYAEYRSLPEGTKAVDPLMKTLEVYRREGSMWVVSSTHGESDIVHAEPFGAMPLELAALSRIPGKRGS